MGENGSGKSTLIEALAVAWGFNAEGGSKNFSFGTRESHSPLHAFVRPVRSRKRARDGFFLRAESYFNVGAHIEDLDKGPGGPPIIGAFGGVSLHEQSHGESFFALLENRFRGNGLYILDEPEAALSPNRQLSFLSRMHSLVEQNSQFIIATHSPILMAMPEATILVLDGGVVRATAFDEVDHVRFTRAFLNDPAGFLRHL